MFYGLRVNYYRKPNRALTTTCRKGVTTALVINCRCHLCVYLSAILSALLSPLWLTCNYISRPPLKTVMYKSCHLNMSSYHVKISESGAGASGGEMFIFAFQLVFGIIERQLMVVEWLSPFRFQVSNTHGTRHMLLLTEQPVGWWLKMKKSSRIKSLFFGHLGL